MSSLDIDKDNLQTVEILLDQKTIARKVEEMGQLLTYDYRGESPVLVGVLKGCIVFLSDLMRAIKLPLELEFISAASYRHGTEQDEEVVLGGPVSIPLKERHVLLVEGVVDSGRTVSRIQGHIRLMEPASLEVVTLIDKPASHRTEIDIKYKGFTVGNEFVIGYGLDNTQQYRNLPFVGKLVDR